MTECFENSTRCEMCLHRGWCKGALPTRWAMALRYCGFFTTLYVPPTVVKQALP